MHELRPLAGLPKPALYCLLALLGASLSAVADPLPPAARAEVVAMLGRLESSGCQFKRNSSWHSGPEARAHLLRKLDYVEKNASAKTAEEFIALAASKSSITGQAYLVQCAKQTPLASAVWLQQQLQEMRIADQAKLPK